MVKSINKLLENNMRVKFFNIEWDMETDFDDGEPVELKMEMVMDIDDGTDIEYEGADILTDEIGYCVVSFEFEIIGE
jgi:hypothetical protein